MRPRETTQALVDVSIAINMQGTLNAHSGLKKEYKKLGGKSGGKDGGIGREVMGGGLDQNSCYTYMKLSNNKNF